jgi:hypothetical protein
MENQNQLRGQDTTSNLWTVVDPAKQKGMLGMVAHTCATDSPNARQQRQTAQLLEHPS